MENLNKIVAALQQAFNDLEIKRRVLEPEWLEKNLASNINSTGFCYAASEVIYRLTGGKDNWKKFAISKSKWEHGGHCYLINKKTNEILYITSDQYTRLDIAIPYELGVAGGFRQISVRANDLSRLSGLGDMKASP